MPLPEGDADHRLTLAVWDLPSPVVTGRPLTLKVGVKCSHGCDLSAARIEIRSDEGRTVGSGMLGAAPLAGTSALYWTEVELTGPEGDGPRCWTASVASEVDVHPIASSTFQFVAVKPPEHRVVLTVTSKDTGAPVLGAEVRFGPFRAATDEKGQASVELPSGTFELTAWKVGYDAESKTVNVADSLKLELELVAQPIAEEPYWM